MILRRVIQHVRKQEWTAIAIDFVIVVIGVVVGIQVSNWNIDRETRRKAEVFSERLTNDLRIEAWSYQSLIEYNDDVRDSAERAVEALSGENHISNEVFLISAYRATQYSFIGQWRATFDELISTGEIGLIADNKLRSTAISLYNTPSFDLILASGQNSEIRRIFRRSVPSDIQRALMKNCGDIFLDIGDYESIVDSLDYECAIGIPASRIDEIVSAMRENDSLLPALRIRIADIETTLTLLEDNQPLYDNLREIGGFQKRSN